MFFYPRTYPRYIYFDFPVVDLDPTAPDSLREVFLQPCVPGTDLPADLVHISKALCERSPVSYRVSTSRAFSFGFLFLLVHVPEQS